MRNSKRGIYAQIKIGTNEVYLSRRTFKLLVLLVLLVLLTCLGFRVAQLSKLFHHAADGDIPCRSGETTTGEGVKVVVAPRLADVRPNVENQGGQSQSQGVGASPATLRERVWLNMAVPEALGRRGCCPGARRRR